MDGDAMASCNGGLMSKQVNPGWAWYKIEQNGKVTALISVAQTAPLVEQWYYGADYVEPSPAFPKGVALTFTPVTQTQFDALRGQINVTRAFKHTITPL